MMKTPAIRVCGDAQAEAVAVVLRALPALSSYEIRYCDARGGAHADERTSDLAFAYSFEQQGSNAPEAVKLPRACRRVTFPVLHLKLLWPLAVPSDGAFPWSDKFIAACVERGLPADEIMRYYEAPVWSPSWPNLDLLFKEESVALSSADSKADVKIGSFVLKHFRKRRLFWAPTAPTNGLLVELVYRLLHAALGAEGTPHREDVSGAIGAISPKDLMSHVALPIHPLVAKHFSLEWCDPAEQYPSPGEGLRSFAEFYRELIASASR